MELGKHEARKYSSKMPKVGKAFNITLMVLFGILSIILIGLGIFCITHEDYWIVSWFLIPIGLLFAFLAYTGYKQVYRDKQFHYTFELNENGIAQKYNNKKRNKTEENMIPFEDMEEVMIGNFVDSVVNPNGRNFFVFGVLIIIFHKEGKLFHKTYGKDELDDWLFRLQDKEIPIHYTEYDLKQAFLDQFNYDVDFRELEGVPWEQVDSKPPLGKNSFINPFPTWKIAKVEVEKDKDKRKKTRKVDLYVMLAIFLHAIIVGLMLLPNVPIENNTYIILNLDSILYEAIPWVIPIFFVFWRKYYIWLMPFVYYVVHVIGVWGGLYVQSLFTNVKVFYQSIATFSFGLVYLWYIGLFIVLGVKLFYFLYEKYRNRVPRKNKHSAH